MRPRRVIFGSLSKSLHGRSITVTTATPAVTVVHVVPGIEEEFKPPLRHKVTLLISNPTAATLNAEVHYNNGSNEIAIPAHDSREVNLILEGDSPRCHVANPNLAVSLINGQSGTLTVAGGFEEHRG